MIHIHLHWGCRMHKKCSSIEGERRGERRWGGRETVAGWQIKRVHKHQAVKKEQK